MADDTMFAGCPAPFVHAEPGGAKAQQLLWGEFVRIAGAEVDGWLPVKSRRTPGWMRRGDLQAERLLEVAFVDIGPGPLQGLRAAVRLRMAQKLERKRGNGEEWDWHRLEPGADGALRYVPKHAG